MYMRHLISVMLTSANLPIRDQGIFGSKARNAELRDAVTGILLSSELAMLVPELPRAAQIKIKFVHDLAKWMSGYLEADVDE